MLVSKISGMNVRIDNDPSLASQLVAEDYNEGHPHKGLRRNRPGIYPLVSNSRMSGLARATPDQKSLLGNKQSLPELYNKDAPHELGPILIRLGEGIKGIFARIVVDEEAK